MGKPLTIKALGGGGSLPSPEAAAAWLFLFFFLHYSVKEGANKEVLGILVSYRVKVKLVVARGG